MPQDTVGICWPHGGTVGCATLTATSMRGHFPSTEGDDARVVCTFVAAGKYRNGAARSWCRTHQQYWGVKADLAVLSATGTQRCARHAEPMGYLLQPRAIDIKQYTSVTMSLRADNALQVSALPAIAGVVAFNQRCKAVALVHHRADALFTNADIVHITITPVLVHAWCSALQSGKRLGCVDCTRCGHPHLDLGTFSEREHRRHYCGNCGHDGTHSSQAIVSTPIFSLLKFYGARLRVVDSNAPNHPVL